MSKHRSSNCTTVLRIEPASPEPAPHYDAIVGTLVEAAPDEDPMDPMVEYEGPDGAVLRRAAATTVELEPEAVGHPVVLMFLRGDLDRPVITGRLRTGQHAPKKITRTKKLVVEGRELVLHADGKLTLECGKSSITLSPNGKIELRGTNVVSRATSINRIRGGKILLN